MSLQDLLTPEGLLDKKKLLNGKSFGEKALLGPIIDIANGCDFNGNKKADIVEFMPFIMRFVAIGIAIAPFIDVPELIKWFVSHTWVTDKPLVTDKIAEVNKVASEALEVAKITGTK